MFNWCDFVVYRFCHYSRVRVVTKFASCVWPNVFIKHFQPHAEPVRSFNSEDYPRFCRLKPHCIPVTLFSEFKSQFIFYSRTISIPLHVHYLKRFIHRGLSYRIRREMQIRQLLNELNISLDIYFVNATCGETRVVKTKQGDIWDT